MMPSRGLQRAQRDAPRLFQLQCRNLSSASRRIPRHSSVPFRKSPGSDVRLQQWKIPVSSINGIRHASSWWPFGGKSEPPASPVESAMSQATPVQTSNPAASPAVDTSSSAAATSSVNTSTPLTAETGQSAATPPPEPTLADPPNIDIITIDTPDLGLPGTVGYLKDIGLDYGWGPTSILQWTIEHFHVWGGLPWWGAILATSVALRLVLLPLYMQSSDIMARQQALTSVTKPITDRMQEARKSGNTTEMQQAYAQFLAVRKSAGISMPKQFLPMLVQGVFGYCAFKLLRACAALPVPAFKYEGFLWLSDLTVPDPYLILPAAMAGVIHLLTRLGGESGAAGNQLPPQMQSFLLYGMPVIVLLATGWLPGALVIWFTGGGLLGIGQSLLLRQPKVREILGISQIYKPPPGQEDINPMKGMWDRFTKPSKTIDVKAKVTTERSAGAATAARSSPGTGKNEAYMRPTYQKPNLRFTSPARASSSDVTQTNSPPPTQTTTPAPSPEASTEDGMIPPSGKTPSPNKIPGGSGGVLDRASEAWKRTRENATNKVKDYIETRDQEQGNVEKRMEKREKDVARRRNEEYEKRRKAKESGR